MPETPSDVFYQGLYVGSYALVLVALITSIVSTFTVLMVVTKGPWRCHYRLYAYIPGLVVYYGHFLLVGPPALVPALGNILYWSALVGLFPLALAPGLREFETMDLVLRGVPAPLLRVNELRPTFGMIGCLAVGFLALYFVCLYRMAVAIESCGRALGPP